MHFMGSAPGNFEIKCDALRPHRGIEASLLGCSGAKKIGCLEKTGRGVNACAPNWAMQVLTSKSIDLVKISHKWSTMSSEKEKENEEALRELGSVDWKHKNANWAVKQMITGTVFPRFCQFISNEKDEMFGSDWQKSVCCAIGKGFSEEALEEYWESTGKKEARRVLNNKRNNATQTLKKKFIGECLGWLVE